MFGGTRSVLAALLVAMLLPASALATTVTMDDSAGLPAHISSGLECKSNGTVCGSGKTLAQAFALTQGSSVPDIDFAPAAGKLTSWRVTGEGPLQLRVIESGPEGGWAGIGTSALATNEEGGANATSLPIGVGDMIGVDFPAGSSRSAIGFDNKVTDPEMFEWNAATLAESGEFLEPSSISTIGRLQLSAEVVLAPVIASLSSATGSTAGGNAVTIAGKYLDGATGVTFGSTPASSFSVDSPGQITAIAPASAAATVDIRVTGPGGASEATSADRYTFAAPASTSIATPGAGGPAAVPVKLAVSGFGESASKWRRGSSQPRISSAGGRSPVGTTFSFSLNEAAAVSLEFSRLVPGRRVGGRCIAPRPALSRKPRCKRALAAGSLPLSGHTGTNKVVFQGHLSRTRSLSPGTYEVTANGRDARGVQAVSRTLSFTIAAR
jgi:IPT/TIG domain